MSSQELLPPKKHRRDRSSSSTPTLPQEFEIGESSRKTSLEPHKQQIEEILNHLDELSVDRIQNMEDNIEGLGKAGQRKPEVQWTADERKAANLNQRLKSLIMTFKIVLMIKRIQEAVMNTYDLEQEYQAKALLAKSKRFFKKAKYNKVKAKLALLSSSASAPSSLSIKNKGLIAESHDWDEEEVSSDDEETEVKALMALTDEKRISVGKESSRNSEWTKITIKKHVNTEILKRNQNLRVELKEITFITKTWLNSSNKVNQCINEKIPTQNKKILGIGQLTEDTSSCGSNDLVFIKSLADNLDMSITSSNLHKSSEAKDSTLPNHDTDEVPSNKSQRNTTDPSAVVSYSLAPDYDLADESSVCSTPFLPLKKLDGGEPGSGPKTVKSILKSKSTFKAETLKGITLNEPSSAPTRSNKSFSASKTNSAPADKLKNVNVEDDPLLAMEYVVEFWYSATTLENFKVSFSIPTRDVVRKWFPMIGYGEEVSTKGTLRKNKPVVFKAPKTSSRAESVSQGTKPGAKTGYKKLATSSKQPYVSSKEATKGTGPHILTDQTKSVSKGMETVLTQIEKGASSTAIHDDKEEASTAIHGDKDYASSIIKLEDLSKLGSQIQPSFKDLNLPKDDRVIIVDESDDDEPNAKTEDTLVLRSSSLSSLPTELKDLSSKFNELTEEIKGLKTQVHELEIELPKELQEIFTKLEDFTKTATSLTSQVTELKTLQWELPEEFLSLPAKGENIKKDKGKNAMYSEEAEKESTKSESDKEAHVTGFMVKSSKEKKLKKFDLEEAKAKAAKQEGEVRKAELIDLLGLKVVHKYYNYKLQYDRYCDKMLNRRVESRITNCEVLTRKGPITFKVYKEDGTYEVIPNFKDPFDKPNDLANKKRKYADDIHDYFKATKRLKLSVQYRDHLSGTVLNEHVLGMIMFNSYHRHDFVTIKDLKDFSNTMLYTVKEVFFRRHQGPWVDDHARTFSSLLLAEVDKRNLNPLKQIGTIEQLRQ
nr:retrovirus-related Pol polyprotein from transposon TNT 1-94 [Tanacetum cinerariifolium]